MSYNLPLDKMTIEEKLQTMELLWDDLCKSAGSLTSPEWHRAVLEDRELQVRDGDDEFIAWDTAKKDITNTTK